VTFAFALVSTCALSVRFALPLEYRRFGHGQTTYAACSLPHYCSGDRPGVGNRGGRCCLCICVRSCWCSDASGAVASATLLDDSCDRPTMRDSEELRRISTPHTVNVVSPTRLRSLQSWLVAETRCDRQVRAHGTWERGCQLPPSLLDHASYLSGSLRLLGTIPTTYLEFNVTPLRSVGQEHPESLATRRSSHHACLLLAIRNCNRVMSSATLLSPRIASPSQPLSLLPRCRRNYALITYETAFYYPRYSVRGSAALRLRRGAPSHISPPSLQNVQSTDTNASRFSTVAGT